MGIYASDDFLLLKTAPFLCGPHGDGKCPPGNVLLSFHLLRLGFKDFLVIIARGYGHFSLLKSTLHSFIES